MMGFLVPILRTSCKSMKLIDDDNDRLNGCRLVVCFVNMPPLLQKGNLSSQSNIDFDSAFEIEWFMGCPRYQMSLQDVGGKGLNLIENLSMPAIISV